MEEIKLTRADCYLGLDALKAIADSEEHSVFAQIIAEELVERGWDSLRLVKEMGGDVTDELGLALLLETNEPGMRLGSYAERIGRALGVSPGMIQRIYDASQRLDPKTVTVIEGP